jgi:hypothetical protein
LRCISDYPQTVNWTEFIERHFQTRNFFFKECLLSGLIEKQNISNKIIRTTSQIFSIITPSDCTIKKMSIKFNKMWVLFKLCGTSRKLPLIGSVVVCIDNEFVCSSTCI